MSLYTKSVVFVTGGSRGIGKAIVEKFQLQNWIVATCATTLSSAEESGADLCLECNVANADNVRSAINTIFDKFGRLDAVINNAGIAGNNSLDAKIDDKFWHHIIDTNLHGT